jgi:23S rRNA (cytosine1962-C5)-methyltransferase
MKEIQLARGKGRRVEQGHPWVYDNEIEHVNGGKPEAGEIVKVFNFKNQFIGSGYYNAASTIRVRILTRIDETVDAAFFYKKLAEAKAMRERVGYKENYRLVFSESDMLPGLVIDKFGKVLVLQSLTAGIEKHLPDITTALLKLYTPTSIIARNDVPVRALEGLEEYKKHLHGNQKNLVINELGVKFQLDLIEGQKTGFFLDQKENRLALKDICKGADVLDAFTYNGSFALFAALFGAKSVEGYDVSEAAIVQSTRNAQLNGITTVTFKAGNAFDVLPDLLKHGKKYDVVILDPPAFTKSRKNVDSATRGYKEVNLRGLKLVKPGGYLLTFSCSHFMPTELLRETVFQAAVDAGKTVRQIQFLQQAKDHPVNWAVPETEYLKGFLLQVD